MSSATGAGSAPNPPSRVSFAAGIGRRGVRTAKDAFTGLLGGIVGLAPHVLHHFGFLARHRACRRLGWYSFVRCARSSRVGADAAPRLPAVRDLAGAGGGARRVRRHVHPLGVRYRPGHHRRLGRRATAPSGESQRTPLNESGGARHEHLGRRERRRHRPDPRRPHRRDFVIDV